MIINNEKQWLTSDCFNRLQSEQQISFLFGNIHLPEVEVQFADQIDNDILIGKFKPNKT